MKKAVLCAVVLLFGVVLLASCAKRADLGQAGTSGLSPTPVASATPSAGAGDASGRAAAPAEARVSRLAGPAVAPGAAPGQAAGRAGSQAAGPLQDVFFDFDKDEIRDDQKGALDANATWLKSHPGARITVEGHADERGTNEYNLALGDRRAKTTRDYLVAKGVEPNRMTIVSYGEERPFVLGHDESAWRWNRRSHFVITGQ